MAGGTIRCGTVERALSSMRIGMASGARGKRWCPLREIRTVTRCTGDVRVLSLQGVARQRVIEIASLDGLESRQLELHDVVAWRQAVETVRAGGVSRKGLRAAD